MNAWSYGTEQDTGVRTGRMLELARTAHRLVTVNTWVQPDETVLILTDPEVSPMIVDALATQVAVVGGQPLVLAMPPQTVHGAEPPAPVAAALRAADVIYAVVSRSISHTTAAQTARKAGVRYLGFSNITEDAFMRGAATGDPAVMREIGARLRDRLVDSEQVRVTSELGMDVTFSVKGRPITVGDSVIPQTTIDSAKEKGLPDNARMFPDGELYCCPLEDSVNGRIVVDRWVQGVGIMTEPMTWEFRDGVCIAITGGPQATTLTRLLDEEGDEYARRLGEFAIGINPRARMEGNPHREGKKILGGVHFALGTGTVCGGQYQSTIHLDGTISPPKIYIDGELAFDAGRLLL